MISPTSLSSLPQFGHSNVRSSWSGLRGTVPMRDSIMRVRQRGQSGRWIESEYGVAGLNFVTRGPRAVTRTRTLVELPRCTADELAWHSEARPAAGFPKPAENAATSPFDPTAIVAAIAAQRSWSYFASRGTSCPVGDTGFPGLPENGRRSCSASLLASEVDRSIGRSLCTAETTARTSAA